MVEVVVEVVGVFLLLGNVLVLDGKVLNERSWVVWCIGWCKKYRRFFEFGKCDGVDFV